MRDSLKYLNSKSSKSLNMKYFSLCYNLKTSNGLPYLPINAFSDQIQKNYVFKLNFK